MNEIIEYLGLKKGENLSKCNIVDSDTKEFLSESLNSHGILDKLDAESVLSFLCGEEFLQNILIFRENLKKSGIIGLGLDIDETLSHTNLYIFEIMSELFGNPENLTPQEMFKKYKHCKLVPYWKENQDAVTWRHKYWENNEFQTKPSIIPDVNKYYNMIHSNILPINAYITVRPDTISIGTDLWLKSHGFPDAQLICRPQGLDHTFGSLWKACILIILFPYINGIVDDNPGLVKMLPATYKGHIFLFSQTSCEFSHFPNIHICPEISDVEKNISIVFEDKSYC